MLQRAVAWFKRNEPPVWLMWFLILVLILRIPSLFEPYYYGDEMIYLALGTAFRRGITLYKYVHDNKPPLLYIMAGISGSLMVFKAILGLWLAITIILYHRFISALTKNKQVITISTIIFGVLSTLPTFEGNIANAELFMIGPTILAFSLLLTAKNTPKNLIVSGLLFSIAILFKFPAIFDIPVVFLFWLATRERSLKQVVVSGLWVGLGVVVPIATTIVYYYLKGAGWDYLVAAFLQNLGYVSSWAAKSNVGFLQKNSGLLIRFGLLILSSAFLFWKSKTLSKNFVLFCLWLLFGLFAVTLSERPYPHYFVQALPAFCFLLALLFADKSKHQVYSIVPLTLAFSVFVIFKFWYYPTSIYYQRFLSYMLGHTSLQTYHQQFDNRMTDIYTVSGTIIEETLPSDPVFIWGDTPGIYALSKRLPPIKYVAGYHINDFYNWDQVLIDLGEKPPKIIVLQDSYVNDKIRLFVNSHYGFVSSSGDYQVWKLIK